MILTTSLKLQLAAVLTAVIMIAAPISEVTANENYGFQVVGRDVLGGISDGKYTDLWSHNGYAYVGTFQQPDCDASGVFIVDVAAAVEHYPNVEGATVAEIRSSPNTRINDVKVHTVGDVDVLIATQEPCGMQIPGSAKSAAHSKGEGPPVQLGQGGISLYDVTHPNKPKALKKNFLEYGGVHNTFAWDFEGKSYLVGIADTFDFYDVIFVDITKPQSPRLLTITGALDWIPQGLNLDQTGAGSSSGTFSKDVSVEIIDSTPTAVVSYWDLGFVTLDVTDPANPIFLGDSTYTDPDPISGLPYEGNASAAAFGGNGDYIFGGDEDFSPGRFGIRYDGTDYPAGQALFGPPSTDLAGTVVWTGGEGCTPGAVPPATGDGQVALIQRGNCFFQDKADNAETQGYDGYIVANDAARGDAVINMSPRDDEPVGIPGVMVGFSTGEILKTNPGITVDADTIFDGWGYLHVINNTGDTITLPSMGSDNPATMDVPHLFELGYYAPAEAVKEGLGTGSGDFTIANIKADPLTQDIVPTYNAGPRMFASWYSAGIRALEYRPGHYHANLDAEGFYSQNVQEIGRFVAENGSDFWGVHVDELEDGTQIILGSDRNTGLWIFTISGDD